MGWLDEENDEDKGYAYVYRGWLWFVISYKEGFGWEQFQETVNDIVDDDNMIFKLWKLLYEVT